MFTQLKEVKSPNPDKSKGPKTQVIAKIDSPHASEVDPRKATALNELKMHRESYFEKYKDLENVTPEAFQAKQAVHIVQALKYGANLNEIRNTIGEIGDTKTDKSIAQIILDDANETSVNVKKFKYEAIYQFLTRENSLTKPTLETFVKKLQPLLETYINNDDAKAFNFTEVHTILTMHKQKAAAAVLDRLLNDEENENNSIMCKFKIATLLKLYSDNPTFRQPYDLFKLRLKNLLYKIIIADTLFKLSDFQEMVGRDSKIYEDVRQCFMDDKIINSKVKVLKLKFAVYLDAIKSIKANQLFFTDPTHSSLITDTIQLAKDFIRYDNKNSIDTALEELPWAIKLGLKFKIETPDYAKHAEKVTVSPAKK